MKSDETQTDQMPTPPSVDIEFVKIDIVDSAEKTEKLQLELNGAKMNC